MLFICILLSGIGIAQIDSTDYPADNNLATPMPPGEKGRYMNYQPTTLKPNKGFGTVMWKFITTSDSGREPEKDYSFTADPIDTADTSTDLRAMWIGHSAVLFRLDGKWFLTDPMLGKRASPVPFAGPKRFFPPPLTVDDLPPLEAILISHNHYDHLDKKTIKNLQTRNYRYIVPQGLKKKLMSWSIPEEDITELVWWQEVPLTETITLACTPARHFSGRGVADRNKTLWCSWVLMGKTEHIYFSADGGYSASFRDIGNRYGPFGLAFMETGAYNTDWRYVHMFPEESVRAFEDVRGKVMFPIHWGTFKLAFHTWRDPVEQVQKLAQERGIDLCLPRPGQLVRGDSLVLNSKWWE